MCRQGSYQWRAPGARPRERTGAGLTELIQEIHTGLSGGSGVRQVQAGLTVHGHRVVPPRVWRLMKTADLHRRHPRAWRRTTIQGLQPINAPDLIGQDLTACEPSTRWCGITYVQTVGGWARTATVIDSHSREVTGHAVADHQRTSLVTEALAAAIATRKPRKA